MKMPRQKKKYNVRFPPVSNQTFRPDTNNSLLSPGDRFLSPCRVALRKLCREILRWGKWLLQFL